MAVRDESELADGSLDQAGQMLAGGRAGPGDAMTAEGSEPSAPLDGSGPEPAPHVPADFRRLITRGGARR